MMYLWTKHHWPRCWICCSLHTRCEMELTPPTTDVSMVLVVMIYFAFADPRQVSPPSGNARMCPVSLPSNLNLKLDVRSTLLPPPLTVTVWTSFIVPFLSFPWSQQLMGFHQPLLLGKTWAQIWVCLHSAKWPVLEKQHSPSASPDKFNGTRFTLISAIDDNASNSFFTAENIGVVWKWVCHFAAKSKGVDFHHGLLITWHSHRRQDC